MNLDDEIMRAAAEANAAMEDDAKKAASFLDGVINGSKGRQSEAKAAETFANMKKMIGEDVNNMSFGQKAAIAAGRETDKLISGAQEIIDGAVLDPIHMTFTGDDAELVKRQMEREKDQAEKDRLYQPFDENAGFAPKMAGGMLPYMVTGVSAGPTFTKMVEMLGGKLAKGATTAARAAGTAGKEAVDLTARQPGFLGNLGTKMQQEWVDPIATMGRRFKAQLPMPDPWMKGVAGRIVGDTALGGVEGMTHYDNDIGGGALSSAVGSTLGQFMKPLLHRMPDFYNDAERAVVEKAKDMGMRLLPGQDTGHRGMRQFENNLRGSNGWSDLVNQFDRHNASIINREAMKATGLDLPTGSEVTPDILRDHFKGIKEEYENLVNNSNVVIERSDLGQMHKLVVDLQNDPITKSLGNEMAKTVASMWKRSTNNNLNVGPSQPFSGPITTRSINGRDYQDFRRLVKDKANDAFGSGDSTAGKAYNKIVEVLDKSLDNNMASKVGSDAWKDLNERFALTKLMVEDGLTPLGRVDANRLTGHFLSQDAERLLTEAGSPRLNSLQNIVKVNSVLGEKVGGGMFEPHGGLMFGGQSPTMTQKFMGGPAAWFPGIRNLYMKAYATGWPSKYGLLGFDGKGFADWPKYTRAAHEYEQPIPEAMDSYENLKKKLSTYTQ